MTTCKISDHAKKKKKKIGKSVYDQSTLGDIHPSLFLSCFVQFFLDPQKCWFLSLQWWFLVAVIITLIHLVKADVVQADCQYNEEIVECGGCEATCNNPIVWLLCYNKIFLLRVICKVFVVGHIIFSRQPVVQKIWKSLTKETIFQ